MDYLEAGDLRVADVFFRFINEEALPGTGIDQDIFWTSFGAIVADFAPINRTLLETRDAMQAKLDSWHCEHQDKPIDGGVVLEKEPHSGLRKFFTGRDFKGLQRD